MNGVVEKYAIAPFIFSLLLMIVQEMLNSRKCILQDIGIIDMHLNFFGKIDEDNVRKFICDLKEVNQHHLDSMNLSIYISSPGGNVDMAIEIYHFLRLLDCQIRTVNISCVNSASMILFAAGKERFCLPNASFYVHSITKKLDGIFTSDDLIREAKEIENNTEKVAGILMESSNKNKAYWKRIMKKGCLLTSQKAEKIGLVNMIGEQEIRNLYK